MLTDDFQPKRQKEDSMTKHLRLLLLFFLLAWPIHAQTGPGNIQLPAATTALSAVTTNTNSSALNVKLYGAVLLDVTITGGTVNVNLKGRIDTATSYRTLTGSNNADGTAITTITATGSYIFPTAGMEDVEVFTTSISGATVTVKARPIPSVGKAMPSGGGGGSTSLAIGTTPITGGTSGRVLFDNAGVVGEDADLSFVTDTLTVTKEVIGGGSAITSSGPGGALGSNAFTSTSYMPLAGGTFTGDVTHSGAAIVISGNISTAAWTTNGVRIKGTPGTLTDTTSSGTVPTAYTDVLGGNTIAASSATTFTNYFTQYNKDPVAGTNVTLTNKWAIGGDSLKIGTSNSLTVSNAGVLNATSPVFVTPTLGAATATTINGNTFTTGTYTLTGTAGKTLNFLKSLTLDGTDSTTMTFPTTSATIARTDAGQTFTGTQAFGAITATGTIVQTSASATAFESGPNGSTNPVWRLVNSTASQADGVSLTGGAAGNGAQFTALSSGSNAGFAFVSKGSGSNVSGLLTAGLSIIVPNGQSSFIASDGTVGVKISHFSGGGLIGTQTNHALFLQTNASGRWQFDTSGNFISRSDGSIRFSSTTDTTATADIAFNRSTANNFGVTNASSTTYQTLGSNGLTFQNGAAQITGGAGNMTITSGTGNSRTMALQTTTSGGVATTALTLGADQSATFASTAQATAFLTGTTSNDGQFSHPDANGWRASVGNSQTSLETLNAYSFATYNGGSYTAGKRSGLFTDKVLIVSSDGRIGFSSLTSSSANDAGNPTSFDTVISRISAGLFGVGTGAAGSFAGSLKLTTLNAVTGIQINGAATLGNVLTGDGANFVSAPPSAIAGGSSSTVKLGGALFDHYADVSTTHTDGTEDDLYSDSVPASTLNANGHKLRSVTYVNFVSSATASRRLKAYFGGTNIFDSGALTLSLGGDFWVEMLLIRESSTVVRAVVTVTTTSASSVPYVTYTRITGLTLTNANTLKTTGIAAGTGAASGDIAVKSGFVEFLPAQ